MVGTRSSVPIGTPASEDIFPDSQLGTQSTSTMESSQSHQQNQTRFETATAPFNSNDSRPSAPSTRQVNPTPNQCSHLPCLSSALPWSRQGRASSQARQRKADHQIVQARQGKARLIGRQGKARQGKARQRKAKEGQA
jgi:hypothetical protein